MKFEINIECDWRRMDGAPIEDWVKPALQNQSLRQSVISLAARSDHLRLGDINPEGSLVFDSYCQTGPLRDVPIRYEGKWRMRTNPSPA